MIIGDQGDLRNKRNDSAPNPAMAVRPRVTNASLQIAHLAESLRGREEIQEEERGAEEEEEEGEGEISGAAVSWSDEAMLSGLLLLLMLMLRLRLLYASAHEKPRPMQENQNNEKQIKQYKTQ